MKHFTKVINHLELELEKYQNITVTEKRADYFKYMSEIEQAISLLNGIKAVSIDRDELTKEIIDGIQ